MRSVSMQSVRPGARLGRCVRNAVGTIIAREGTVLSERLIERFKDVGIDRVLVMDPRFDDLELPSPVLEGARLHAAGALRGIVRTVGKSGGAGGPGGAGAKLQSFELNDAAKAMADEVVRLPGPLGAFVPGPGRIGSAEHSVDIAVVAAFLGGKVGLATRLVELSLGTLAMDLGLAVVGDAREAHPEAGFRLLDSSFSSLAKAVVLQHHERLDGSGFPRRLKGDEIHPLARVAAVADTFLSLVGGAGGAEPLTPHEAMRFIVDNAGKLFDPGAARALEANVVAYPRGVSLVLTSGEKGVVVREGPPPATRPTLRVLYDSDGRELADPYDLDLRAPENSGTSVERVSFD